MRSNWECVQRLLAARANVLPARVPDDASEGPHIERGESFNAQQRGIAVGILSVREGAAGRRAEQTQRVGDASHTT